VCELSRTCPAESLPATRKPGERSCPKEALKVENHVEFAASKPPDEQYESAKRTGMEPRFAQKLAVKKDYLVQVRMMLQQCGELGPNEPANFCIGKTLAQGGQGRERQYDIAQRAGFYYQDVFETFRHSRLISYCVVQETNNCMRWGDLRQSAERKLRIKMQKAKLLIKMRSTVFVSYGEKREIHIRLAETDGHGRRGGLRGFAR
jgi:hypothetical protein